MVEIGNSGSGRKTAHTPDAYFSRDGVVLEDTEEQVVIPAHWVITDAFVSREPGQPRILELRVLVRDVTFSEDLYPGVYVSVGT